MGDPPSPLVEKIRSVVFVKGLMTRYPLYTEILGKPQILNTVQGSYINPLDRKSIWAEKNNHKAEPKLSFLDLDLNVLHARSGVNKKPEKFIFEYWVFSQKFYLNVGCFEEIHICIPKIR